MKINVDDWHFQQASEDLLVLDVFLDNGQHGVMEVYPMKCLTAVNGGIPEIIVFCELPGERISETECPGRWVTRPPTRDCPWSNVQLPQALLVQVRQRLGVPAPEVTA